MKRYLLVGAFAFAAVVAVTASARSPINGPYLSKMLGQTGPGSTYAICHVTPGVTRYLRVRAGQELPPTVRGNTRTAAQLSPLIAAASREPFRRTAVHVTQQIPRVELSAGEAPTLANFPLLVDSSAVESRVGTNSAALRAVIADECRGLMFPRAAADEQ